MRGETKSENVFCFWIIRWGHIRSWTSQSDVKIYWCSIKLCNSKCSWPMVNLLESRRPHKQTLRVVLCIASSTAELLQPNFSCSAGGEISSEIDRSSLCDIEKSSFKCFEIGLKMILPTQVHTQRITKTLLVHLPDL